VRRVAQHTGSAAGLIIAGSLGYVIDLAASVADPLPAIQMIVHQDVLAYGCFDEVSLDQIDPPPQFDPRYANARTRGRTNGGVNPYDCVPDPEWPPAGVMRIIGPGSTAAE